MLKELGKYKHNFKKALYSSDKIRRILLEENYTDMPESEICKELDKYIFSHLYIDDLVDEEKTYIFFDVRMPHFGSSIKNCDITMFLICHKNIVDNYYDKNYYGNRTDILTQYLEEILEQEDVKNKFGIGSIQITNLDIYNNTKFYGRILGLSVPNFR